MFKLNDDIELPKKHHLSQKKKTKNHYNPLFIILFSADQFFQFSTQKFKTHSKFFLTVASRFDSTKNVLSGYSALYILQILIFCFIF